MDMSMLPLGKRSREDGRRDREQRKVQARSFEQSEKAKVVKRDGSHYCRLLPNCSERAHYETAHLNDKGMGGDHGRRSTSAQMVRACWFHHQGNWSLHSNDLRVEFLTPDGADGPIQVWGRLSTGDWYLVGRETAVGHWERD